MPYRPVLTELDRRALLALGAAGLPVRARCAPFLRATTRRRLLPDTPRSPTS